jgi:thioredoxin reductase (NADPH)
MSEDTNGKGGQTSSALGGAPAGPKDDEMFPKLTPEQIARLAKHGRERTFSDGDLLFEVGAEAVPFFVVLEGAVEIFQSTPPGSRVITTHEARQFTGDVGLLSSRRSVAGARARGRTRVIEVPHEQLRTVLMNDADAWR